MNKPKSVGILGCGWLGLAFAKALKEQQYPLLTTVRSDKKCQQIIAQGLPCSVFDTASFSPQHAIFQQQILLVAITPGFKRGQTDYAENIINIVNAAQAGKVEQLILISSTGVYGGVSGIVDEHTVITLAADHNRPEDKTELLYAAEQAVLTAKLNGQVLRLSGLVGEDRLPGKFLAGKSNLAGANNQLNLIHQQDVIGLLFALITYQGSEKVFIGASKTTACKAEFYQKSANLMALTPPSFSAELADQAHHQVNSDNTRNWLNYQYQYDDLFVWLDTIK